MNFRRADDNEISEMAVNIVGLLGGSELSAIDSNVRSALIASLGSLPAELQALTYEAVVLEDQRMATVTRKNTAHERIEEWIMQVRNYLQSGFAEKRQFDLCGLYYPPQPVNMYVAADPTELSVTGNSTGENKCRFRGNNRYGHVMYEIWRREKGGEWTMLGSTKKQSYTDAPVRPGHYYEYRVRAAATKNKSNFSDRAVVYSINAEERA